MKRADIEAQPTGTEFAAHLRGYARPQRTRIVDVNSRRAVVVTSNGTRPHLIPFGNILMPWPQWEAEQKAKAERDAAVQRERIEHDDALGRVLYERLCGLCPIVAWDPERRTVTLRWEDLARLLGVRP